MSEAAFPGRRDLEDRLVARAWADEDFRERLKADPRAVVAEEIGITVPESIDIQVLEETPERAYLVIPLDRVSVSEEELDAVSGGNSPWDPR
jgi:broad-specificity NMP kinase